MFPHYYPPKHRYRPNGDVLVRGDLVDRYKRNLLGCRVRRTMFRLGERHTYSGPTFYLEAPMGYEFDGATVPRPLWWLFERFGRGSTAFLYHDILYDHRIGSKVSADAAMLEILIDKGCNRFAAVAIFVAVLLWPGNWWHWYKPARKGGTGRVK